MGWTATGSLLPHASVTFLPQLIWAHLKMKAADGWRALLPFVGKKSRWLGECLSSRSKKTFLRCNFSCLQRMPFGLPFRRQFMVCYFPSCQSIWFLIELSHCSLWVLSASWSVFCLHSWGWLSLFKTCLLVYLIIFLTLWNAYFCDAQNRIVDVCYES